jgi:hypothetical protein
MSNLLFRYRRITIYDMNTKRYAPTTPCRNGHTSPRLVSTNECIQCARESRKRWLANPENRLRNNTYENQRRRKLGWSNPAQKIRQQRYDRKRRGLPEPTRPQPLTCECCDEIPRQFHLDHCHKTGRFRGWLCNRCNRGLGYFGDNTEGLQRAIEYLKRAET